MIHPIEAPVIIDASHRFRAQPRTGDGDAANALLHGLIDDLWGRRSPFSIAPDRPGDGHDPSTARK